VTAPLVVADTNVIVSGLLTSEQGAPTVVILDRTMTGEIRTLLSVDLLAEYRLVLLRPAIRSRHGLDEHEVDTILTAIAENAVVCEPIEPPTAPPDRGDLHLWSILAARPSAILVTGDQELVANSPDWATVVTPRSFVSSHLA
jgi:putative PIN family toxin of toxin-antitoxin system